MQSSEPHVAQKFVAIPPDLVSLLQWDYVAKTARYSLSAAVGVLSSKLKQPDLVCTFVLFNEHMPSFSAAVHMVCSAVLLSKKL